MSDTLEMLVARLVEAQRQLDEFTGGQVDAVVLPSAVPILLPHAQRQIVRSEAQQRQFADDRAAILDALPAQIALLDPAGRISFVNKAWKDFAAVAGLSGEAYPTGRNYVDLCDLADDGKGEWGRDVAAGIRSLLAGATQMFAIEYPCCGPDENRWFELLATPMPESSSYGAVVMHIDVTARKWAEAAMRASEAQFRDLAEAMPQIVWTTRADGSPTYFNRHWMEYTGLTLADTLRDGRIVPVHPDDRKPAWQAWQQATATGSLYSLECRLRATDGTYKWWLVRGTPLKDATGEVVKWFGTCTDIHELKEAQARLREQATLLDTARDSIVVLDLGSRVLYWNSGAERLYGWTAAEAMGRSLVDDFGQDRALFEQATKATLAAGEWFGELEQRTKGGNMVVVESRRSLVRDELNNPKSILVITTDVTQRRGVEAQLRQAQRLEAVGQLTGGVAHDFNNILMVVMANVDALLEGEGLTPEAVGCLDSIGQAAERATNLTRQLLAFSRKQALKMERTNLNDLVVSTGALLRRTLGEHIEINSVLAEEMAPISTDRAQVQAALVNLCINARDAMPDGGRLLIETKRVELDDDYVRRNPEAAVGCYAMMSVTDTGTGMPPDVLAKVFEPFFTTKEVGKGTGLGLSMVYGFVKQSKGHVTIDSEMGRGTTVTLYLPHVDRQAAPEAAMPAMRLPRGTERILVVEDDDQVRDAVVRQLASLGYAVTAAANGSAGLALLQTGPGFDLLLTDVVMPGPMNGAALALAARALLPGLGVLFMSGYPEDAITTKGVLNHGATLLSKPFRKADLATAVRRAIDAG
ncbi:MAG: PAS domain S-box protein [Alphaproteobacteria bacterium]|nr:PAS domain S-box protein [Alphaproteobacteria bacterium]